LGASPDEFDDTIGIIELELLRLVRHLETFGRRSALYLQVDRAGYLVLRTIEDLGALEAGGLVERRPDPNDRRSSTIALTDEGRRMMGGVERERRQGIEALVGDWAEREKVSLGRALNRLNASLRKNGRTTRVD
jgi:hypothetical protein